MPIRVIRGPAFTVTGRPGAGIRCQPGDGRFFSNPVGNDLSLLSILYYPLDRRKMIIGLFLPGPERVSD